MHMKSKYDEIMGRPHHVSKTRPQMPMSDRAAQFAPFAALTGYDAAIKETGRLTDDKIELDEEALTALDMKYQLLMDALFNVVLLAKRTDEGRYIFETQTKNSTAKSPMGAFETFEIENDIQQVLDALKDF